METYTDFDEASVAKGDGQMLCGTLDHEKVAHYFVMPVDASDEQISDRAFEIREGRPRSEYERWLMKTAESLRP